MLGNTLIQDLSSCYWIHKILSLPRTLEEWTKPRLSMAVFKILLPDFQEIRINLLVIQIWTLSQNEIEQNFGGYINLELKLRILINRCPFINILNYPNILWNRKTYLNPHNCVDYGTFQKNNKFSVYESNHITFKL